MNDVVSFDLDAIGGAGDDATVRGHRRRARRVRRGDRRRPGRAGLRDRPGLGDDRARVALRRLRRGAQAGRPLRAGHASLHRPIEAGMTLDVARDAGRAARPSERHVARDQDGDARRGRRARQRAVRDGVLPRRRDRRRASASARRTIASSVDGDCPIARSRYPVADDQTERYAAASGDDFAIHLDDEFARKVGLPGRIVHGLCTLAFAGPRRARGRGRRRSARGADASRSASRRRSSPATR